MTDATDLPAPRIADAVMMVRAMAPRAVPGRVVFRTLDAEDIQGDARGWFREAEGLSAIVPAGPDDAPGTALRQITLDVHSALDGVGLTAAVAGALAERGIPCNMVAAHHHDHIFVPEARADEALAVLKELAART